MVVIGLGKNLLFKSVLAHCEKDTLHSQFMDQKEPWAMCAAWNSRNLSFYVDLVSSVQLDFLLMFYGLSVDVSFNYGLSSATVPAANVGMEKPHVLISVVKSV